MVTLPSLPLPQIKYAELRDSGQYQCQVNTEPKMSESVFLSVRGECYQLILCRMAEEEGTVTSQQQLLHSNVLFVMGLPCGDASKPMCD